MNKKALHSGEKIAKEAIVHLIILSLLKGAAGLITGMHIMVADAISTLADTLGVFASYFGLRLSRKSADKNFEYGYYKIETFAALVVSLGIIYAGYIILKDSLATLQNPVEGEYRAFAITATVIAIYHSRKLAISLQEAGEKVNSLSLIANARDKKMDFYAGFVILISIIANYQNIPYVEGVISIIIAGLVLKTGITSTKESLFFLLDYWNDPILKRKILKVFKTEKDLVISKPKIKLRRAGTFIFGEAFIEINPYAGMQDLREEIDLLKSKIEGLNPYIKDFAIYTHISKDEKVKVAVPIKGGTTLNAGIASNLNQTTAYLFATINKGKIKDFYIKKLTAKDKLPVALAEFLKNEKVKIVINNKFSSLIYYNLRRTNHILVYPNFSNLKKAKQALELLVIDT